ncbi:MAG: SOS response-associated peptidase [Bacteroidia bacterium]|jgi:putative SOS response-associated peptidase YedK|nr:SOS response-associated peptidase [Bacteroidia bacterium]
MCYKVANKAPAAQLEAELEAEFELAAQWQPEQELSGFAHPLLPVLTGGHTRKLELMRWGLIPHWVSHTTQAAELAKQTLNARAETIFEKPSFRDVALTGRCVIPVTGFYEWQTSGRTKTPYFLQPAAGSFFLLGGLHSAWAHRETGEIHHTFSIVTVPANPLMAEIHNTKQRMPLILPPVNVAHWNNPALTQAQVRDLCQPFHETLMRAENLGSGTQTSLF